MNLKSILILMAIVAVISAGVTRFYFPKTETKTVEVTKEVVKTDVRTVVRTVERPDGTKETTSETVDHTVKHETETKKSESFKSKDWVVSVSALAKLSTFPQPIYGVQVQRRILGPFYLGAMANTDQSIGVSVGMEF